MFSGSLGRFTQMHSSKPASQQKLCINSCMTCMETLDLGGPAACGVHCLLAGLLITRVCDAAFQSLTCVRHLEVLWTKWVMISYQNFSCLHIVVVNCVNDGPFVIDHHSLPGAWTLDIPRSCSWSHKCFEQIRACKSRSTARLPRSQDLVKRNGTLQQGAGRIYKNPSFANAI